MVFYSKHVFVCTNKKDAGKPCCANAGGELFFDYLKTKLKSLGLHGEGKIRVSKSGCLGQCALGPGLVVYPEGVWYRYHSFADIDEIIHTHLINNEIAKSLLM